MGEREEVEWVDERIYMYVTSAMGHRRERNDGTDFRSLIYGEYSILVEIE